MAEPLVGVTAALGVSETACIHVLNDARCLSHITCCF
jgi:hypothetical protein